MLTLFETIEAGRNWRLRIVLLGCEDVAEESVLVGDERGLEFCLRAFGVFEGDGSHCERLSWVMSFGITRYRVLRVGLGGSLCLLVACEVFPLRVMIVM